MSFRQITVTSRTGTRLTLGARIFDAEPLVELSINADDGARATILFEPSAARELGKLAGFVSEAAIEMAWGDDDDA